jgi:hypothetical protein
MINNKVMILAILVFALTSSVLLAGEESSGQTGQVKPAVNDSSLKVIYQKPEPVKEVPLTKARIKFDEPDWNFGSIQKGAQVAHNFWFSNNGPENLVITKIKPSCGCTTTKSKGMTVPPGGRGFIDISFNSGRFNNVITKGITVETNDAVNPYLELRFTATINNPVQIIESSPLEANFESVLKGQSADITLKLKNTDSTRSKIEFVELPDENTFKITPDKLMLKPSASADLKIHLGPNLPTGPFVSSLTLAVTGKGDSRITIPIVGTIVDQLPTATDNSAK